jgi:hypothetical protein
MLKLSTYGTWCYFGSSILPASIVLHIVSFVVDIVISEDPEQYQSIIYEKKLCTICVWNLIIPSVHFNVSSSIIVDMYVLKN